MSVKTCAYISKVQLVFRAGVPNWSILLLLFSELGLELGLDFRVVVEHILSKAETNRHLDSSDSLVVG